MKSRGFGKIGQTGVEMTIILAVGLSILIIILTINQGTVTTVDWHIRSTKARALVDDVANAAELVYAQGEGAKTRVFVNVPNDVESIAMSNNVIEVTFRSGEKVYRTMPLNMTGTLPHVEGNMWVIIEATENGSIIYSEGEGFCGNSIIEGSEDCDGSALGGATCISQGFDGGTLACASDCTYDTSGCTTTQASVNIALHDPTNDDNFMQDLFTQFVVNVTCSNKDCGSVNVSVYTQDGLIPTGSGTPFYTNRTTNPATVSLDAGDSQLLTFWINTTGAMGTVREFFAAANMTSNMSNNDASGRVNITIVADTSGCLGVYLTDGEETDSRSFSEGTFSDTIVRDDCAVVLDDADYGTYYSEIFDMDSSKGWTNISWESMAGAFIDHQRSGDTLNMTGCVLLLHLDELSGDTAYDSSGNGDHGSVSAAGTTQGVGGKYDTAYQFNGDTGEVNITNLFAEDFTVEFWIKTDVDSPTSGSPWCPAGSGLLWSDWGGSVEDDVGLALLNNVICFWSGNPDDSMVGTADVVDGEWHHIVARRDMDAGVKEIFVDSQLDANGSTNNNALDENPVNEVAGNSYDDEFFNGALDEIIIFNRTITDEEIEDHYRMGSLRLNLSVRSCPTSGCSGVEWIDISDSSPQDLNVSDNQYFQFMFVFNATLDYTPELYNVTVHYGEPDTTNPTVTLVSPDDANITTSQTVAFNCSATDNSGLSRIELWTNASGWALNDSCSISGLSADCTWSVGLPNSDYIWSCNATDEQGNEDWASNRTVTVNYTGPAYREAMMVYYDSDNYYRPQYRIWNGTDLGGAASATSLGSGNSVHGFNKIVSSPTQDEKILITQDDTWRIRAQEWDSSSWGSLTSLSNELNNFNRRQFDIAYEQSGDAVVVYKHDNSDSRPRYRTWDGSWSSHAYVESTGSNDISWIRLEANPSGDEMILAVLDSGRDLYAQVWDGDSWGSVQLLDDNVETNSKQLYDIAWESQSGDAIVAYGHRNSQTIRYWLWNGSWNGEYDANTVDDQDTQWLRLVADPNSDQILMGVEPNNNHLNLQIWDGSSWGSNTAVSESLETNSDRNFDLAWESQSGRALAVYGKSNTDYPRYVIWDGSWSSPASAQDIGGDPGWIQLASNPSEDEILMLAIDRQNDDLWFQRWNSTVWLDEQEVENKCNDGNENFYLSYDAHI